MILLRRYRVALVLSMLGVVVAVLVGHRILKQQAAAVPRRQVQIGGGGEQARAAIGTAEANLRVAGSNVEAAKVNATTPEANLVRARALAGNDARTAAGLEDLRQRGLISPMDRDNSRTNAESSHAQVVAAATQVAAARSQIETQLSQVALARAVLDRVRTALKIAQTNLDNTRITAPFSGYISARYLYPGAAASSQAASTSNSSVGIVVSNGVLLVEHINERRSHGEPLHVAVPRAGGIRLRSILMTTLTTVVGLFPMALAIGVGTEANQPLAIAVIGGRLVSTFFTLFLIPTLYVIFEERYPRQFVDSQDEARETA